MKTNSGTLNNKAKNVFMTKTERQNKKKIQERNRNRVSFSGHLPFPESKLTTLTQVRIKKKMELKLNPPKLTNLFSGISFFFPLLPVLCVLLPIRATKTKMSSSAELRSENRGESKRTGNYTRLYIYTYILPLNVTFYVQHSRMIVFRSRNISTTSTATTSATATTS